MKHIIPMILMLASSSVNAAQEVPTKAISEKVVFFDLRDLVNSNLGRWHNKSAELTRMIEKMRLDTGFLLDIWVTSRSTEETPTDYLMSLTYDVYLLQRTMQEDNVERAVVKLKAVAEDLNTKANHCKRGAISLTKYSPRLARAFDPTV